MPSQPRGGDLACCAREGVKLCDLAVRVRCPPGQHARASANSVASSAKPSTKYPLLAARLSVQRPS